MRVIHALTFLASAVVHLKSAIDFFRAAYL